MYKIGPINIEINNLYSNQPVERLVIFQTNNIKPKVIYNVLYKNDIYLPNIKNSIYHSSEIIVSRSDTIMQYYHIYQKYPYALVEEHPYDFYNIFLCDDIFKQKIHPYFLLELLHLERVLIHKNNLVFHSSYIAVNGSSILFTAPSGGGKSTQAELWKKYKNAEIINGDKSIIGKEGEEWKVYGIPFSGSSEYCQNKTFPLKAIVILDKGPINQLSQVGIRGFSNVFFQITVNPWDKEFCEKAMNLVIDVCNEVPIYYYSCTKTKEAVDVLYKEFIEKGILNGTV